MYRYELNYSDDQLIEMICAAYGIKVKYLQFIEVGSFYGFVVEALSGHKYFLKIYPQDRAQVFPIHFNAKSLNHIGSALKRFREEFNIQNLSYCLPNKTGSFCLEQEDLLLVLFDHIEGFHPSYSPNQLTADKLAQIFFKLHQIPYENFSDFTKENFDIQNACGLEKWINQEIIPIETTHATQMLSFLNKHQIKLIEKLDQLKKWREAILNRKIPFVITHGDAHHFNVLQTSENVWLVDWDDLKIGPIERDLWHYENAPLIVEYKKLNPEYNLDRELCAFYQLQRFFEDSCYYLDQVLLGRNSTLEQSERDKKSFLGHWGWGICLI